MRFFNHFSNISIGSIKRRPISLKLRVREQIASSCKNVIGLNHIFLADNHGKLIYGGQNRNLQIHTALLLSQIVSAYTVI